jgi:hypothetical protein
LIQDGRLLSPIEVHDEIRAGQDALSRWVTRRRKTTSLFVRTTGHHVGVVKQIIARFPEFVEHNRPVAQADPFVVALAVVESKKTLGQRCIVVTEEKFSPSGRPRIPHVCESYHLPYMSIHQVYVAEGWSF